MQSAYMFVTLFHYERLKTTENSESFGDKPLGQVQVP